MSLLHCVVARDEVILAESGSPNYSQITQTILSKIPPNASKLTYAADSILIHFVRTAGEGDGGSGGVIYLVIGDDLAGRRVPFTFLADLERKFTAAYNSNEIAQAPPFGMASFSKEIAKMMKSYIDSPPRDSISTAQAELSNVKDIMVRNIDAVLSRGERIELLIDKTDSLSTNARAFRNSSAQIRRTMWWKNVKVMILIALSSLLFLYLIITLFCGFRLQCRA